MEIKKRILCLDIGEKRIGIAVSDAMWFGSIPIGTIKRDNNSIKTIIDYLKEYNTDTILIGLPYNMDGSLGFQAERCLDFIKPLEKDYTILKQDERLSSYSAEEYLKEKKVNFRKNKGKVDTVAACIILQEYLDNNRR